MKRGDMVRVVSGKYAGETGLVIRVTGGWVDFVRADSRGVQVPAGECELIEPDAGPEVFAREHMGNWDG